MQKWLFSIFFVFAGYGGYLNAQPPLIHTQHYGIEQGLSHRDLQCILQDQNGVIWLGTMYGLNRFDGYQFKWYTKETHGLQSNTIRHIIEQPDGLLWLFHTFAFFSKDVYSIDIFNPATEQSLSFETYFQGEAPVQAKDIISFDQNEQGEIVLVTNDHRLITYDGSFQTTPIHLDPDWNVSIKWANNDLFWVSTYLESSGIGQFITLDRQGKQVHQFTHDQIKYIRIFDVDKEGNCSYFTVPSADNEVPVFYKVSAQGEHIPHPINQKPAFVQSLRGLFRPHEQFLHLGNQYWYNTGQGLSIFDTDQDTFYQEGTHFEPIELLRTVVFDQNGFAWVAGAFGLWKFQFKKNNFTSAFFDGQESRIATRAMCTDEGGNLWVVPEGRRILWKAILDGTNIVKATRYRFDETQLPLPSNFVAITKSDSGRLWYAVRNLLVSFDPESMEHRQIEIAPPGVNLGFIWAVHEDDFGKIWFANDSGKVGYWDGQAVIWLPPLGQENPPNYCYYFHKTSEGSTWLATDKGLFVLDMQAGRVLERYWSGGQGKYFFPYDNVYHLHEEDNGTLWIATGGTGLIRWEQHNDQEPRQFTRAHGLNNTIYAVYPDNHDHLWLPSDLGIIRFDKTSYQVETFLVEDGISHNEFNRVSHFQAPDGRLFFGSLHGVTVFHPDDFQIDFAKASPPLVITDYQQIDQEGQHKESSTLMLHGENTVTLHPSDRFFRIDFALLTYDNVDKNRYAYTIEGIDKDWNYQKENFVRFTQLPYGNHRLRIKGQRADGKWSDQELNILLHILKPFYRQWWFIISLALSLFLIGFYLFKRRTTELKRQRQRLEVEVARQTRELRQQSEKLKSLEKLKSRFFANVSHELRTPLTLMLGPINAVIKRKRVPEEEQQLLQFAQRNAKQLLKLISEILDISKLESGKLEVKEETVTFGPFLQRLAAQFSSYASSIRVELSTHYQLSEDLQLVLDKDKVEKILQNFLSNAMKFTPPGGKVTLNTAEVKNGILLSVADTGPGIPLEDLPHVFDRFYQSKQPDLKAKGGTGIGLSLCRELATLLKGKVWAESEVGKGSTFYFWFPKKVTPIDSPTSPDSPHSTTSSPAPLTPEGVRLPASSPASPDSPLSPPLTPEGEPLPASNSNTSTKPEQSGKGAAKAAPTSNESTILLVEDNPDLREYIKILLPEHNIITAENGQEALAKLQRLNTVTLQHTDDTSGSSGDWAAKAAPTDQRFNKSTNQQINLIISDLMMPVMDGFEFLDKVKADDHLRHIPFIMLTAKVNAQARLRALRVGVDDYLHKPFEETELKARIENLLRNYRERMALFAETADTQKEQTETAQPVLAQADAEWLQQVEDVLTPLLPEYNLKMTQVAEQFYLSYRQFSRKLKELTGLTPRQYLQEMRMARAKVLLSVGQYKTVQEVALAVGFTDARYFSNLFYKHQGKYPSDFLG